MELSETILVIMLFLSMGVVSASLLTRIPLPYTVLLVLLGVALKFGAEHWHALEPVLEFKLTPDVILFVFLPVLIYEAGLSLNARQLIKDIAPILILAIPALLISTFIVAAGTAWLLDIDFRIALIFGALISATDPVAVIALFKELGAPRRLTILVEGESLFNDATSIVVFSIVVALASQYGGFTASDMGAATLSFFKVFLGGALIGLLIGALASLLANNLGISGGRLLILSLAAAYLSFIIAEHGLHLSGVMAVATSAIICGILIIPHLSDTDEHSLHHTWEFLADICNTLLFILIGLSVNVANLFSIFGVMLLIVLLVQATRATLIYSLVSFTTKLFKLPTITRSEQHIMWWGGLKGGLAVAMVLSIPDSIPHKQLLIDVTAGVVMFTLLINAPSIRLLIKWVGMDSLTSLEQHELGRSIDGLVERINRTLGELSTAGLVSEASEEDLCKNLNQTLENLKPDISDSQRTHFLKLNLLAWEIQELQRLFQSGLIQSITYIDILNEKHNTYDRIARNSETSDQETPQRALQKLDRWLVRTFREKDWAIPLMVRFLNIRLNEYLKRQFTNILIDRAVLKRLQQASVISASLREPLIREYEQRIELHSKNIEEIRTEFPPFYQATELAFSSHATLVAAQLELNSIRAQGELSIKPYTLLNEELDTLISQAESNSRKRRIHEHKEQIRQIPLFSALPEEALQEIARRSSEVTFLKNDIVIGEGDTGNALYIILDGDVRVHDKKDNRVLGHLHKGDFFGEMALLGDDIRTANVEAETACLLLRITRKVVMETAREHDEIIYALEMAREERARDNVS